MADDAREYTNLAVYARQIEDPHDPTRPNPHDVLEPVTGVFEIGVVIDGARVPIFVEKASKVVALIERNRVAAPVEPPPGETVAPQVADEPPEQRESPAPPGE